MLSFWINGGATCFVEPLRGHAIGFDARAGKAFDGGGKVVLPGTANGLRPAPAQRSKA